MPFGALADLRAIDAIPEIEAVAATWPPDRATARLAKIIVEVLRGNDEYVLSRIRAHDHVDMPWLARAAELLSADQAQAALRVISESQTVDPRCRHYCDQSLRRIRETAFRHRRLTSFDPERTTSR